VLDFLKQHCPEDRELFRLVSLHFSLFSEVAELWESEGHSRVHTLLAVMAQQGPAPVLLTNTEDTKKCLHTAMMSFTHASEYFLQVRVLCFSCYFWKSLCFSYQEFCLSDLLLVRAFFLWYVMVHHIFTCFKNSRKIKKYLKLVMKSISCLPFKSNMLFSVFLFTFLQKF
jgi:hypothetical protein